MKGYDLITDGVGQPSVGNGTYIVYPPGGGQKSAFAKLAESKEKEESVKAVDTNWRPQRHAQPDYLDDPGKHVKTLVNKMIHKSLRGSARAKDEVRGIARKIKDKLGSAEGKAFAPDVKVSFLSPKVLAGLKGAATEGAKEGLIGAGAGGATGAVIGGIFGSPIPVAGNLSGAAAGGLLGAGTGALGGLASGGIKGYQQAVRAL
jgi:hypothetical protein